MISKAGLISASTLVFLSVSAFAQTFSLESWKQDLETSIETGKPALNQVLSANSIAAKIFRASSKDSKIMEKARLAFGKEKFSQALNLYNLIGKDSPYWLEAVEEKAWTFHRQQDFERSLAQTRTLLSEPLIQVVGSEPFFLQALSQLKICDYAGVLGSNKLYKETQRERILALEDLAKSGQSVSLSKVIESADEFPLKFTDAGSQARLLPRLFFTDKTLQIAILKKKMALIGAEVLKSHSASNPKLAKLSMTLSKGALGAEQAIRLRIKNLAKSEVEQNDKMIQKISLIEVETIQRMHSDKEMDPDNFNKGSFTKLSENELSFPDDGNPWLDELDKYQVKANACPRNIRRKM
jgi:hypothetical protein